MKTPIIVINPTVDEMFKLKSMLSGETVSAITEISSAENFASAIANGGLIRLNENISLDGFNIPSGATVVLDLNGNTLSSSTDASNMDKSNPIYDFVLSGNVTLKNGSLNVVGIKNTGSLKLDNVHITKESNYGAAIKNETGASLTMDSKSKITVNAAGSVTDTSGAACIRSYGNLTINGSEFESKSMRTYAIISDGTTTINDIIISGKHGGIAFDSGNAVINDGEYIADRYYGAYLSIDAGTGTTVKIYGGTFRGGSTGANTSVLVGSDDYNLVDASVEIYGGTFYGKLKNQSNVLPNNGVKIYGGLFEEIPNESMIADGYSCSTEKNSDGFYEVTKNN